MKRKFLRGLVPLLAIAAVAVVPMAAQAAPHYYNNGVKEGEEPTNAIAWGTITLALTKPPSVVGTTITCHNAAAGQSFNPAGGGAGQGTVELFATYKCESEKNCILGENTVVVPETLPWKDLLTEEVAGTIRQETTGVKVNIECVNASTGKVEKSTKFKTQEGEAKGQRPQSKHGTSALHPGFLEFAAGAGELGAEGTGGTISGKTEGEVKTVGYNEQELLNTANP